MVFEREMPPHSSTWESTVLAGSVRLLETNKTINLHKYDWLRLGAVDSERLSVAFDPSRPDRFKLQLHATVEKVETGPTGFIKNRAPTWLEYLYHQQHLALFWGAVVFLWGMFWSVRNLL
jgi:hypothetical protein